MSAPSRAKNYRDYAQIKQQMAWELRLNKEKVATKRFQELGENNIAEFEFGPEGRSFPLVEAAEPIIIKSKA